MNDNNNTPKGWGKSNGGNGKGSPWENKSKTSAWGNSPSDSAWKNTSANSGNKASKSNGVDSPDVSVAVNKFANIAKKAGEKAAEAAKNAVDHAKSEETAEKLNDLKDKAGSAVSGVGSKLSEIKNKASDKISERRNNEAAPDDNSSEQNIEDTFESEAYTDEVSGYEENPESSAVAPVENQEEYSDTTETIENVDTPKNTPPPRAYPKQNGFPRTQPNRPNPYTARDNRFDRINSAPPPVQSSPQPAYIIQEKKSPVIPILVIVLLIIILAFGILLGVFLVQRKNESESERNASSNDNSSASSEAEISAAEPTDNNDESSEVSDSTSAPEEPTEEDKPTASAKDREKAEKAYINTLTDFTKTNEFDAYDYPSKFALYDVDGDGIDELFIQYMSMIGNAEIMYYYKNGSYNEILSCAETSFEICPDDHLVQYYMYGGGEARFVSEIDSRGVTVDEIAEFPDKRYERNGSGIARTEYDEAMEYYDSFRWIKPSFKLFSTVLPDSVIKAKPRARDPFLAVITTESTSLNVRELPSKDAKIIGDIPKDTYITAYKLDGYPDWYKVEYSEKNIVGYCSSRYIVDSETYKKALDKSEFVALGQVATKKDPLNMRASDDEDSEIIYKIPKDHYVGIISYEGDWLYVKYFADANSPVYYGYVKKDYIKITERY